MRFKLINFESYYLRPGVLGLFRVMYCSVIMIFIGMRSFSWISSDLNFFFDSPSISPGGFFGGFPGHTFFITITLIQIISFVLMFLGIWCRWTSLLFTLVSILGHNYWYSFGKIDHTLLWIIAPAFLGFAGWGNRFTVNKREGKSVDPEQSAFIISLLALCIAFSMFTAGIQKIQGGWWKWSTEAVRYHLILNYYSLGKNLLLADFFISVKSHLIWKFFDYSALVLELGFLFSAINKKYFQFFIFFGVIFHILVLLMFNIRFNSNLLVYFLFLDWNSILRLFKVDTESYEKRKSNALNIIFLACTILNVYWIFSLFHKPSIFFFPGLIDLVLGNNNLQLASYFTLNLFFAVAFAVLLFSLAVFIRNHFFNRSLKSMP